MTSTQSGHGTPQRLFNQTTRRLLALAAAVAVSLAAGCSSSNDSAASGAGTIRIGVTPAQITFAPVFYAQAAGYFKDQGLNVKLVSLSNGTTELAALLGGDVDVIAGSAGTFANATAKGGKMIAVMGLAEMSEEVCVLKSWADSKGLTASTPVRDRLTALKGSVLGDTSAGSSSQTDFEFLLKQYAQVDPHKDVTFTSTGSPAGAEAALQAKKITAFLLSPPTCQSVAGAETLISPTEVETFQQMINNVLFTKTDWASSHSAELTKAVTAVARAANYEISSPTATAQQIKSSYPSGSESLLADALKKVAARVPNNGQMTEDMWKATSDLLIGADDITTPLVTTQGTYWTNKYIDQSYLAAHTS